MDNLNKENFFNEMSEKYPAAMDHFCLWIDEYKKRVDWENLFNGSVWHNWSKKTKEGVEGGSCHTKSPKFHDIPYEMQIGIFMRYVCETFEEDNIEIPEFKEMFESCMQDYIKVFVNGKG